MASIVEPHEKMRGRDVNKVARGEQAPRPPQQSPQVSRPPPPSSTTPKVSVSINNRYPPLHLITSLISIYISNNMLKFHKLTIYKFDLGN